MKRRTGFTLIELLAESSPSSPSSLRCFCLLQPILPRGARRIQCKNNLKQIGLAMHNYHDANSGMPMSFVVDYNTRGGEWSVHARLLPYVDEANLYMQIDLSEPYQEGSAVATTRVYVSVLASHRIGLVSIVLEAQIHYPINYGFNAGGWFTWSNSSRQIGSGVFHPNPGHMRFADIADSTAIPSSIALK